MWDRVRRWDLDLSYLFDDYRSVTVVVLYFVIIIICTLSHAPLLDNPNRAGRYLIRIMCCIGSPPIRRFLSNCPVPDCIPLCNEEFATFAPPRTREWL